jgi:hypothetical protein
LYIQSLTRRPSILLLGRGRVSAASSERMVLAFLSVLPVVFTFTFAPMYKDSPAGRYLVLLQAQSRQTPMVKKGIDLLRVI